MRPHLEQVALSGLALRHAIFSGIMTYPSICLRHRLEVPCAEPRRAGEPKGARTQTRIGGRLVMVLRSGVSRFDFHGAPGDEVTEKRASTRRG